MTMTTSLPTFVVSLDFELRWGRHDRFGLDAGAHRAELEGEREVVPRLLDLFAERGIHATWATVGAVACRDWNEYFRRAPRPPRYADPRLAIDPRYAEIDPDGLLHFAPELVELVHRTPGQELGTHTFCHIPLREPGVSADDVADDLAAVGRLWQERFGAPPRSLVFPRNQPAFFSVVRAAGIRIWRGNPGRWYYERNDAATNGALARAFRFADDTFPCSRRPARLEGDMVQASLFLRADLPAPAWRFHVARIRHELARLGPADLFHLWWHPHNVGMASTKRLERVREVLDLVADRVAGGTLRSSSMGELASEAA
jgi:peptidoglycan/xylan/chitin deacetylase (PgdA/CDA1 family)